MLDVLDPDAIAAAAERIGAEAGGLDGLVHNAGARSRAPGDAADRGLPPPDRAQPHRPARGHPGDAARDPHGPRPHRLDQLDRRPRRAALHRRLPRLQVRDRGGRRQSCARSSRRGGSRSSIVEPGSIDTAIWERGERERRRDRRARRGPGELYGAAIASYRKVIRDSSPRTRHPAGEGGGDGRARAAARAGRAPATWSASTRRIQARLSPLLPTPGLRLGGGAHDGPPKPGGDRRLAPILGQAD